MTLYKVKFHGGCTYYNSKDEAEEVASFRHAYYEPVNVNVDLLNEYEDRLSEVERRINILTECIKANYETILESEQY